MAAGGRSPRAALYKPATSLVMPQNSEQSEQSPNASESRSPQLKHRDRLLVAAHCDLAARHRIAAVVAQRLAYGQRDQELRAELLVQRLQPRGKIHGVADHGVFLAPGRT